MAEQPAGTPDAVPEKSLKSERGKALARFARYVALRSIAVLVTVAIGVYVAVWVTNLGGYADEWRRDEIRAAVAMSFRGAALTGMSYLEKQELMEDAWAAAIAAAGLDKPFFVRSFRHLGEALSLTLGETRGWGGMRTSSGSSDAREILLESLPLTLVLFGTANLLSFFGALFISLILSRRFGSFFDRAAVLLVPMFSAPPWFYGIFLIVIFAAIAKVLPYGGIVDAPLPETTFGYVLSVLKHMVLPVLAWILGTMPMAVYAGRAFFLIHSTEDYVEMAKAMGLQSSRMQRRYILRPVLPPIITNFAFMLIVAWQGAILTELVFAWPGLGRVLYNAVLHFQVPVIIIEHDVFQGKVEFVLQLRCRQSDAFRLHAPLDIVRRKNAADVRCARFYGVFQRGSPCLNDDLTSGR